MKRIMERYSADHALRLSDEAKLTACPEGREGEKEILRVQGSGVLGEWSQENANLPA